MSAGTLSGGISFAYSIDGWIYYALFGFFATLSVYNGQRLLKSDQAQKTPWLSWVKRFEKQLYILVLFSAIVSLIFLFAIQKFNILSFVLLLTSGTISFFYIIKIRGKNMRELPYIKIHLIAISWTSILVVFPLVNEGIFAHIGWLALAHYFYLIAVTIPFDIRDLKYDACEQKTIPQLLGVNGSRVLAVILIVIFFIIMVTIFDGLRGNLIFHISTLIQIALMLFMNERRSDFYCAGGIDGVIALLGISYFSSLLL